MAILDSSLLSHKYLVETCLPHSPWRILEWDETGTHLNVLRLEYHKPDLLDKYKFMVTCPRDTAGNLLCRIFNWETKQVVLEVSTDIIDPRNACSVVSSMVYLFEEAWLKIVRDVEGVKPKDDLERWQAEE